MIFHYFTFQFEGLDFEGDLINYAIDSGAAPSSLVLDPDTGWLYGTLDIITTTSESFTFDVVSYKVANPSNVSDPRTFTMTVVSDLANALVINSPLTMEIDNGEISELLIDATPIAGSDFNVLADSNTITVDAEYPTADSDTSAADLSIVLEYSLVEGLGALPVGLALTSTGLIITRNCFRG